jgi:hypothetical protein
LAFRRQEPEAQTDAGEDEGELADLRQARADRERGAQGIAKGGDQRHGRRRLAHHDDGDYREELERLPQHDAGVEEHADGNEEQHRECVTKRQRLCGRAVTQRRFSHRHAGEERAQGE